ncbi:glucose dehydrogenase [FAD, quinone]-like [Phymastichus coffea]|uniref:glucose dehydrogenase [FAD, quinone]-like n=1 Tax=Phymastichus coffea TaxID=108790 RepID=UPI00273BB540|nr:glucose dehydrogenase [FAD, quinone]-like [Phymastichus coffea]
MSWIPNNYTGACQAEVLTFYALLTQYLGFSYDAKFIEPTDHQDQYDFIIVGAGSAGCVVANRLSEIANWKILLLETGDEEPAITGIPGLWPILRTSSITYGYTSQPEPVICSADKDRSCSLVRGKVMGGSSSINDMVYSRGNKQDFDDWQNLGNEGWSFDSVLKYFKKSEDIRIPDADLKYHATGGYVKVEEFPYINKYSDVIISAWKELGLNEIDYNTGFQIGTAKQQYTSIRGSRLSSNGAFLRPIRGRRPNLTVSPNSRVTRIIIDPVTRTATGVEYLDLKTNKMKKVKVSKEVILSAGAFDSPKLLMLSGIGPADHLREANIDIIQDAPVGRNLHEHTIVLPFTFDLKNESKTMFNLPRIQNDLMYWMSTHEGRLAATGMQTTIAFLQTSFEKRHGVPDVQIGFAGTLSDNKCASGISSIATSYFNRVGMYVVLVKPTSRGYVRLNSTDPLWSQPLIFLNSLVESDDVERFIEGMLHARKIIKTQSFKTHGFIKVKNEPCGNFNDSTREYFECLIKKTSWTSYHPVGSCKMGPKSDEDAVIDVRLKVYGINGLRVIDASVMPAITRGGINAVVMMIGEKGSDMIKEDWMTDADWVYG